MRRMEMKFRKLLRQVSPNVLLLDIMPFYTFNIHTVDFNFTKVVKHLYGYFKLDVLRNPWLIFRTISLKLDRLVQMQRLNRINIRMCNWFSLPVKMNRILLPGVGSLRYDVLFKHHLSNKKRPRRIIKELNLEFDLFRRLRDFYESKESQSILSMVESLITYSDFEESEVFKYTPLFNNCKHLKKLKLIGYFSSPESEIVSDTVFQHSKFPQLQILSIHHGSAYLKGMNWNPIHTLKTLILYGCFWIQHDLFKNPSLLFPQLEYLIFNNDGVDFHETQVTSNIGKNWGVFTNLKFLLFQTYYPHNSPISLHALLATSWIHFPKLEILLLFEFTYIMTLREKWKLPSTLKLLYYSMSCTDIGDITNKEKFYHTGYNKQVKEFGEKIWESHNHESYGNGLYNVCNGYSREIQSIFTYYKKNTLKTILEHQWIPGLHSNVKYFEYIKIKLNEQENGVFVKWPWIDFDARDFELYDRGRRDPAPSNSSDSSDSDSDDSPNDDIY